MSPVYWDPNSRACQVCAAVVVDDGREKHVSFHERVDPWSAEPAPQPETPEGEA